MNRAAPAKLRPTPIRAGTKVRAVYDRAHLAWRAGAIRSFHYGKPSREDSAIVWRVDGVEFDAKDLDRVAAAIDAAMTRAGVVDARFADSWCGFRCVVVTLADGSRWVERYDSTARCVVREHITLEAAA
jgi:hypothetical protein